MSNRRIIFEWLRDSFVGFILFVLAMTFAASADAVTPFDYPNLYMLWFTIGLIPFAVFANRRRVGTTLSRLHLLAFAVGSVVAGFLPPDLPPPAYVVSLMLILNVSFVVSGRLSTSRSHADN